MNQRFDVERLLATLPYRPIRAEGTLLGEYVPPVWRYPPLGSYNGFSGQQRVRTWQLGTWLRRGRGLTIAPACELCGRCNRLGLHSENYADIERSVTLCGVCHLTLHRRFRQPGIWRAALDRYPPAPEWAIAVSTSPFDLAQWLRSTGRPTDPFDWLQRQFPSDPTIERLSFLESNGGCAGLDAG